MNVHAGLAIGHTKQNYDAIVYCNSFDVFVTFVFFCLSFLYLCVHLSPSGNEIPGMYTLLGDKNSLVEQSPSTLATTHPR